MKRILLLFIIFFITSACAEVFYIKINADEINYLQRQIHNLQQQILTADNNKIRQIGGVLRPDVEGNWYILDDKGHTPIGLASVEQNERRIRIIFEKEFDEVHWAAVTPDATLTLNNIDCGAGVALTHISIFCTQNGEPIDPQLITSITQNENLWLYAEGSINN